MFSDRLRNLRQQQEMSQQKLSKIIGFSQQSVAKWEVGTASPSPEIISQLADVFCVSTDYLLGKTDDPTPPDAKKEASSAITTEEAIKALALSKFGLNPTKQDMYDLDLAVDSAINTIIQRKRNERK